MADYDYIIVGAGSAGCVLANRLTEDADKRVLIVEAGGKDNDWLIDIPIGVGKLVPAGLHNWNYTSEAEPHADLRKLYHPRGKVLGGSSSINMMAYVRGNAGDYDRWRQRGLHGWSYADVLPYFRRAENYDQGADDYHGGNGPLSVRRTTAADGTFQAFLAAGKEAGYAITEDYNGANQDGFSHLQVTHRNNHRCSAAKAYLHPASTRPNLEIMSDTLVNRLLIENGRAKGIEIWRSGQINVIETAGEVILSGGAYNSPQLMLLSGIGPAAHLKAIGIEPVVDLPSVGQNLQDHPSIDLEFEHSHMSNFQKQLRLDRLMISMLRAKFLRSGFATENPGQVTGFIKSRTELAMPDIQLFCRQGTMAVTEWFPIFKPKASDGISIRACHLRPESRGELTLTSADPTAPPRILNNFLSTEEDKRALRESFKVARKLVEQPSFKKLGLNEIKPGTDVQSDDDIDAFVRDNVWTVFHPAGTCRMGSDPESVVDINFQVRGCKNLRVVDASVMPDMVGGNINAPVMMIAEKASDIFRGKPPLPAAEL